MTTERSEQETTCSAGLVRTGWVRVAKFRDNDDAERYRFRLQRAATFKRPERFMLHNCPQDHGDPEGAWAVWRKGA